MIAIGECRQSGPLLPCYHCYLAQVGNNPCYPPRCLHAYQAQLFCLTYSLSSLVTVEERGLALDSPYSYSILPSDPAPCLITILGITLVLPFIHLLFVVLYKVRCSLVRLAGRGDRIHGKGREVGEGVELVEGGEGLLPSSPP